MFKDATTLANAYEAMLFAILAYLGIVLILKVYAIMNKNKHLRGLLGEREDILLVNENNKKVVSIKTLYKNIK